LEAIKMGACTKDYPLYLRGKDGVCRQRMGVCSVCDAYINGNTKKAELIIENVEDISALEIVGCETDRMDYSQALNYLVQEGFIKEEDKWMWED